MKVDRLGGSYQVLHICVTLLSTNTCFNNFIIYRDKSLSHREVLWSDIVRYSQRWEDTPCIHIEDFNAIRYLAERSGGFTSWES